MADDEAWLRRVLRALLVLGGLLFAGWLLGGCAQSAHAEELPAPIEVVQNAHPDLKRVLDERPALPEVVAPAPAVPAVVPVERVPEGVVPVEAPPQRVVRPAAPAVQDGDRVRRPKVSSRVVRVERAVVREAAGVVRQRHAHVQAPDVPSAPAPMPVQQDTKAGGPPVIGGAAVFPAVSSWVPARPPVAIAHAFGPVPPLVRTAADEPSFAPD
ncbi:hypothetical protein [Actinomadura terrae]|uniref:hypothetical protein n=1 Tax=Actinomadura terrae TaxID=604353 RepID=UPI001FA78A21|nr:hypothetical protein [Actinomadura terrae]